LRRERESSGGRREVKNGFANGTQGRAGAYRC
jgi:hypothetical protein